MWLLGKLLPDEQLQSLDKQPPKQTNIAHTPRLGQGKIGKALLNQTTQPWATIM